jgi:peptidoglycan hydrolase-like protein with peptidoglycan-binding domain
VLRARSILSLTLLVAASALSAQSPPAQPSAEPAFVPPGTPGSPIKGEIFHAQVLLDAAGFSPGVIDGREGSSYKTALRGFQESRGLDTSAKLDGPTRSALLVGGRPSTIMVKLGRDDVVANFVYPFPKKPEDQAKLPFAGYRNMLEKLAERYHTTPETVVALNGREALIGPGQTLRLPNVIPASRDYLDTMKNQGRLMSLLNVDGQQLRGYSIVIDKSDGALKVFDDADRLIAQFPVTSGSTHDPLPLGEWKVTTYAFLPPFHYQPDLFWDVDDSKDEKMLPPGPNGLVGVAWLDLTKEHYGIHGTPEPQNIGKTQSHGCIRMTNWDVLRLSRMLKPGFKAVFQA